MSEFCFHLIAWEKIDRFRWNLVYAILWLVHEIFLNFSSELWSLIDVKISIFRNNEWILITFCLCINIYDPCCDYYILFSRTFHQSYDPWLILKFVYAQYLVKYLVDLIKSGSYIDIFYVKTCATTKISTVAGYHVVLATLLFFFYLGLVRIFLGRAWFGDGGCFVPLNPALCNVYWDTKETRHLENCIYTATNPSPS